jgi:hypothetical protein
MSSYDRVIAEALNEGGVYRHFSPEAKTAFQTYKLANANDNPYSAQKVSEIDFVAGWNACMEYLRTNTNVLGEPKQRHESPHSDDGLPSLGGPEV